MFYLFLAAPFVQALLLVLVFVLPLSLNRLAKIILAIVLVLSSLKIYSYIFTGGTIMDPKLSRYPAILLDCFYFSSIILLVLTLCRSLINLLWKALRLNCRASLISPESALIALLMLSSALVTGVKGVINGFSPPLDVNYTIEIDKLPLEAEGFKILLLCDLHISAPATRDEITDIVRRSNEQRADLILIAGDFVDGSIDDLKDLTDELFKLKAKYGIYAVSGNHEFYSGYDNWLAYFKAGGISFLENGNTVISDDKGHRLFNLAGITDIASARFKDLTQTDISRAFEGVDTTLPVLFMSHQPKAALMTMDKADLTFCGHTHGGLAPLLKTVVSMANGGMVSGLYDFGRQRVIVSNGTRIWAGVPLRLDTPAWLTAVTLTHRR